MEEGGRVELPRRLAPPVPFRAGWACRMPEPSVACVTSRVRPDEVPALSDESFRAKRERRGVEVASPGLAPGRAAYETAALLLVRGSRVLGGHGWSRTSTSIASGSRSAVDLRAQGLAIRSSPSALLRASAGWRYGGPSFARLCFAPASEGWSGTVDLHHAAPVSRTGGTLSSHVPGMQRSGRVRNRTSYPQGREFYGLPEFPHSSAPMVDLRGVAPRSPVCGAGVLLLN